MCGLVGSLATLTAMLALSAGPPAVGVNFTATVHDECAAAVVELHFRYFAAFGEE